MDMQSLSLGSAADTAATGRGDQEWWAAYGDRQLDGWLAVELSNTPSMQEAAARLRRASAELDGVAADREPRVDGAAKALGERFPDHSVYPAPEAGNWGSEGALSVGASYALDFWGKRRQAVDAAAARVDVAQAEVADAALLLRVMLVDAYLRLDAAYEIRDIASAGLALRQGVIDLLAARRKAGIADDIDAIQARDAITNTRDEIARMTAEIALRRHQIAALLGRDPAFADQIARPSLRTLDDPAPLSGISADLLGYRPDVVAARATVEAAGHEIGVARAAFYPDVNLVAFAGVQSLGLDSLLRASSIAAGAGPAITLPIFDGGRLRANLQGRAAEYDRAAALYDATLTHALREVADGLASLESERSRQREAQTALAVWSHNLALTQLRERHGLSSALDRLSVETALLLARRRTAEANIRVATAQIALIHALGGAWAPSSMSPQGPK